MQRKKLVSLMLVLALLLVVVSGCASDSASQTAQTDEGQSTQAQESQAAQPAETADNDAVNDNQQPASKRLVPEGEEVTLSIWTMIMNDLTTNGISSYKEHSVFVKLEEITGITFKFQESSFETGAENFNLMIASGEWTDLISGVPNNYAGGASKAIDDEVIYDLAPYADQFSNYFEVLSKAAQSDAKLKSLYDDDGRMPAIKTFYDNTIVRNGLSIRTDLLKEINADVPTTIDELYDVLTAFKSEYNMKSALMLSEKNQNGSYIVGSYGTSGFEATVSAGSNKTHLFPKDGVITTSLLEDGYFDYLTLINKWYSEGLISNEYFSYDRNATESMNTSNDVGVFYGNRNVFDSYPRNTLIEGYEIEPMADVEVYPGSVNNFGEDTLTAPGSLSVALTCKNLDLVLDFFNFMFTDEAIELSNYGIEGNSFNYDANGVPQFTDLIVANPSVNFDQAASCYLLENFLTISQTDKWSVVYTDKQSAAMTEIWTVPTGEWKLPTLYLTQDESDRISSILADINTYAATETTRFIVGERACTEEEWEAFKAQVKAFGVDSVLEVYQAAYDRYLER